MGISLWQLLIILVIVVLLFGTKKLRNMGGDLGTAFKSFKKAVNEDEKKSESANKNIEADKDRVFDADVEEVKEKEKV